MNNNILSLIPLGGVGDVTRNMYLYEYNNQVLIVDCGLGFADETMLGVDLLLPDISYLLQEKKNIVGMVLTHGHEDHIGALPFILPQLTVNFPIYGTSLTAAFANEKLKEFGITKKVEAVSFQDEEKKIGDFIVSFIRVTHSVPDTSHIFIQTPVGNFYHGSDFKFDETPYDGKKTDFDKMQKYANLGVLCLLSDCLGAERAGRTGSEQGLSVHFEKELQSCKGKCVVTTYSSNISRLNQIINIAQRYQRKVCFIGRSLIKAKDTAQKLGYMKIASGWEVQPEDLKRYNDKEILLLVAGAQGQENSAMSRIANDEHKDVKLNSNDTVIFSSDPIPGNEIAVYELVDAIARQNVRVLYSPATHDFHVSGHGSVEEIKQLISLVKPKHVLPIGGGFRHMYAYKHLAEGLGYQKEKILLLEDGQEVLFSKESANLGKLLPVRKVYVDEITGEELENFVLRDRQKLSEGGIVVVITEVDSATGQLLRNPDIISRGFSVPEGKRLNKKISIELSKVMGGKKGRVVNWVHIRKLVGEISERVVFKTLRRRPLVLPVVIEV